jgi:parallel beta-helix repeat protein
MEPGSQTLHVFSFLTTWKELWRVFTILQHTVRLFTCITIRHWTFDGITVSHTGGYGIWVNQGSFNVTICNSHVYDVGAGGVRIGLGLHGVISDPTMLTTNVTVANSVLEDGGHIYQMGCGVLLQESAMNNLSHNLIHDFYYTGVSIGWTWGYAPTSAHHNYVGFNEIYNIGRAVLSDMGCVYSLGIQPGTMIDNNVCHHVWSYDYGGWGYYTDEGSSNITIQNNIVYNTKCAGFHQHYGENNMFVNNIIAFPHQVGCVPGKSCITVAIRSSQHAPGSGGGGPFSSFTFERNIVYISNGTLFFSSIPTGFKNMTFDNNLYWSTTAHANLTFPPSQDPTTFQQWQAQGKDEHSMLADPQFEKPYSFDFTDLATSSPALKLGFKPIYTTRVGPQTQKGRQMAWEVKERQTL